MAPMRPSSRTAHEEPAAPILEHSESDFSSASDAKLQPVSTLKKEKRDLKAELDKAVAFVEDDIKKEGGSVIGSSDEDSEKKRDRGFRVFLPHWDLSVLRNAFKSRDGLRHMLESEAFHRFIIVAVIFDMILVFAELCLTIATSCSPHPANEGGSTPGGEGAARVAASFLFGAASEGGHILNATAGAAAPLELPPTCTPQLRLTPQIETLIEALMWGSITILIMFFIEILVSAFAFGLVFFTRILHAFDAVIVIASLFLELYLHFSHGNPSNSSAIIILRIWKIVRCMHAIAHTIQLRAYRMVKSLEGVMDRMEVETEARQRLLQYHRSRIQSVAEHLRKRNALRQRRKAAAVAAALLTVPDTAPAAEARSWTPDTFSDDAGLAAENEHDRQTLEEVAQELEHALDVLERAIGRDEDDLQNAMEAAISIAERDTLPISRVHEKNAGGHEQDLVAAAEEGKGGLGPAMEGEFLKVSEAERRV
ncbi:hypothetical protein HDU96_001780 [Phlyctochytrium bullatum]|nr:hypothetical protein HDU96_001780 [Phlyctochytrium bullatum]